MRYLDTIDNKTFENVIAYIFSELGAMGENGTIECLEKSGERFSVDYRNEETEWEKIKECWPAINGCKFNGPDEQASIIPFLIFLGTDYGPCTHINDGWKEICFDCGNHFVVKEEFADKFLEFFKDMEGFMIICDGMDKIEEEKFVETL